MSFTPSRAKIWSFLAMGGLGLLIFQILQGASQPRDGANSGNTPSVTGSVPPLVAPTELQAEAGANSIAPPPGGPVPSPATVGQREEAKRLASQGGACLEVHVVQASGSLPVGNVPIQITRPVAPDDWSGPVDDRLFLTDLGGRLDLCELPPGLVEVRPTIAFELEGAAGDIQAARVSLVAGEKVVLHFRVMDSAAVVVHVIEGADTPVPEAVVALAVKPGRPALPVGRTNAQGQLSLVAKSGVLTAVHPGGQLSGRVIIPERAFPNELLQLLLPLAPAGEVLRFSIEGGLLPGETLSADLRFQRFDTRYPGTSRPGDTVSLRGVEGVQFEFSALKPGAYELAVLTSQGRAAGIEIALEPGEPTERILTLSTPVELEGVVEDPTGRPIGGALVYCGIPARLSFRQVSTDQAGAFRIVLPGGGIEGISLRRTGYFPKDVPLDAAKAQSHFVLEPKPQTLLRGEVVDEEALPLSDILVIAHGNPAVGFLGTSTRTDGAGQFSIQVPEGLTVDLEVREAIAPADPAKQLEALTVKGVGVKDGPLVLTLQHSSVARSSLRGRLVGAPLKHPEVAVLLLIPLDPEREESFSAEPLANGSFKFAGAPGGRYRLIGQSPEFGRTLLVGSVELDANDLDLGDLWIEVPGELIVIPSPNGPGGLLTVNGMAGATLTSLRIETEATQAELSIGKIGPGTYTLVWLPDGGSKIESSISIQSGLVGRFPL